MRHWVGIKVWWNEVELVGMKVPLLNIGPVSGPEGGLWARKGSHSPRAECLQERQEFQ